MLLKGISSSTFALFFIWLLSSSLMMTLAFVNNGGANDDHIEVAELIFNQKKNPAPQDCWQCYHPKLYHSTVAKLSRLLKVKPRENRIILAQMLNAIAGVLTLLICLIFILEQPFSKNIQLLSFSVLAFNPRFIAINGQASNDAFIIFFGTVILYALYKLINKISFKYFFILLITSILAGVTKGNSFVMMFGVLVVFLLKILHCKKLGLPSFKNYALFLLVYLVMTISAIGYFGAYYDNYKKYGKPVVYNTPVTDFPDFIHKTTFRRPGIRSIVEGYFTFRWFDLIQNPMISGSNRTYPQHHTSLWSHLYGRAHFIYFDNWPPEWRIHDARMMNVGRITLILGILPTILLIIGFFKEIKKRCIEFFNKKNKELPSSKWIFPIFVLGFILFIILFSAKGRDFSFMKIIYLYPCILAILIPLLNGLEIAINFLKKNKSLSFIFHSILVVLFISYIIPVLDLIIKLSHL